jgi:class 3 adenylate cyclase
MPSSSTFATRTIGDCLMIGFAAAVSLIAAIALQTRPSGDAIEQVAVVFAPWIDGAEAMRRSVNAGARFVRFGGADFLVVVKPENEAFRSNVHASGALMLVDPRWAGACRPEKTVRS